VLRPKHAVLCQIVSYWKKITWLRGDIVNYTIAKMSILTKFVVILVYWVSSLHELLLSVLCVLLCKYESRLSQHDVHIKMKFGSDIGTP